ncbi:MAG: FHIPEP family type III secretion protein [Candidatus Sericytochromatia bacterium]
MSEDNRIPLKVLTLSQSLEDLLRNKIIRDDNGTRIEISGVESVNLYKSIDEKEEILLSVGLKGVPIICKPDIRLYFRRLIERKYPRIQVISYMEVPPNYKLEVLGEINI